MANIYRNSSAGQGKRLNTFNELCETFGFGIPIYTYLLEKRAFHVGVTIEELGISVQGFGRSGKSAKNNAALRMMFQIMKTAREGGSLNSVTSEKLVDCCEWMERYSPLLIEDMMVVDSQPREDVGYNYCEVLHRLLRKKHLAHIYYCLQVEGTGPSLTIAMSCHHPKFVTIGEGRTIRMAKNVAAQEMLMKLQVQQEQE